jgi:hypothetical protein
LNEIHFADEIEKVSVQLALAFTQRFAGDSAGSKLSAEQARNMIEPLCKNQPDNWDLAATLSSANAALGEKDATVKEGERAIMLLPSAKDRLAGPACEENLAANQAMFGENNRAISTLTRLLQTRYSSQVYGPGPITPALLRLDPIWDPLRSDPAFQKLCEEKQP